MGAKAPRPLTVAKLHWTRASEMPMAKGVLGWVSITVEEGGRHLATLRQVRVSGKVWQPSKAKLRWFERLTKCGSHGEDPLHEAFPLLDCYVVTGVSYPSFRRKLFSAAGDQSAVDRIKEAVKGFVHGRLPQDVKRQEKTVVTVWDPTGGKLDRLQRQAWEEKSRRSKQAQARKERGPGRRPKKKEKPAEKGPEEFPW